jgi:hypothetical protein
LFNSESCTNQLANQGTNDWKNLSGKIKGHETSSEHITNMNTWSDLQIRLLKNKTIDKSVQKLINKEKDRWKNVLQRIIAIIKTLGKNNLPFRGTKEKIYQENNEFFLSLIERANCTFPPLTIGSSQFPHLSIKSSDVPLYVLKICKSPPTV